MVEKVLNIMLIALFATFCIVFAVKTVLIDVVKEEKDNEWEQSKDDVNTRSISKNYTLTIDSRYE